MEKQSKIVVFFGMIATGKSYLASRWSSRRGCPYYNTDVVRKELAGLHPSENREEEIDRGIYSSEFSRRTYDELLRRAKADLAAGKHDCVVLDGSYQSKMERNRVRDVFQGYRIFFVFCRCPESVMKARMDERAQDPAAISDGRWDIYLEQKIRFEQPDELPAGNLITIDTDREVTELLALLDKEIEGKE